MKVSFSSEITYFKKLCIMQKTLLLYACPTHCGYGENDPGGMLINSTWNSPTFPSNEICKLYFDNSREIYFLSTISSPGNNVVFPFPILNRSGFHYARMGRVWGLWGPHGGSGFCAKAVPHVGLWQNRVHLGSGKQEQGDEFTLRLFLSDTRTASQ